MAGLGTGATNVNDGCLTRQAPPARCPPFGPLCSMRQRPACAAMRFPRAAIPGVVGRPPPPAAALHPSLCCRCCRGGPATCCSYWSRPAPGGPPSPHTHTCTHDWDTHPPNTHHPQPAGGLDPAGAPRCERLRAAVPRLPGHRHPSRCACAAAAPALCMPHACFLCMPCVCSQARGPGLLAQERLHGWPAGHAAGMRPLLCPPAAACPPQAARCPPGECCRGGRAQAACPRLARGLPRQPGAPGVNPLACSRAAEGGAAGPQRRLLRRGCGIPGGPVRHVPGLGPGPGPAQPPEAAALPLSRRCLAQRALAPVLPAQRHIAAGSMRGALRFRAPRLPAC